MVIQKRIVSTKRHTKGFVLDNERMTRGRVVKLARCKKIAGVCAKRRWNHKEFRDRWYVATVPSNVKYKLYDLPEIVVK
jgi:hypothetical protein